MEYRGIYPTLPSAPEGEVHIVEGSAHAYRLQNINEIQKEIAVERDKRAALSKKYHRSVTIVNAVDSTLVLFSMGLGVAGIGILSTVIAAPIAMAMEGIAIFTGFLSLVGRQANKTLTLKAEKHEKITTLAESKLNTISTHTPSID
jgi:hypothetical protein